MIRNDKWNALLEKLVKAGIRLDELEEHFIRSGGHGGQNVNKVSTCVYLKHIPTAIEVKCQKTRSQIDNRYFARELLLDKFLARQNAMLSEKEREIYKKRKQKQRRSRRSKQKILEEKREHSQKKNLRRPPNFHLPD